ncbi:MAG: hypothetical protein COV45_08285 [Deltaproteobacteria bacterium CG11_big_fil_rev_8_21_14_0_20_47_16]|nr:MAG: hypothetical protein COV45_08285 [Deltaproteobacteria bacterium CG11_big_fil_rev_8_21_14_0_20_47_16]
MKHPPILMMIASTLLFSIQGVCIKFIGMGLPAAEIAFLRSLGTFAIITPYLFAKGVPFWGSNPRVLIIRGLIGGLALDLTFHALQILPLATASLLRNLHPILIPVFAVFLLKERLVIQNFVGMALALLGVSLLYLPAFNGSWPIDAASYAVIASVCTAVVMCLIRKLRHTENAWVIVNYFAMGSLLVTGPGFLLHPVTPSPVQIGLITVIILATTLAQLAFTWALGHDKASKLGLISAIGPVWASIWGVTLFDELLTIPMVIGGMLILSATVIVSRIRTAPKADTCPAVPASSQLRQ